MNECGVKALFILLSSWGKSVMWLSSWKKSSAVLNKVPEFNEVKGSRKG